MELAMPNKHCLLVDLSRFGQTNPNEIFVPTDEPYGNIVARIVRRQVNRRMTCLRNCRRQNLVGNLSYAS